MEIAKKHGPFDVAFLPVNAAIIQFPNRIHSGQPICLSPEQAVSAAKVLQAKKMVPIHFRMIHSPPFYQETTDIITRLEQSAKGSVPLHILDSKDNLVI
ncbi:MAG: MBL fold metallo-hydrolase [Bacillota bacterium]